MPITRKQQILAALESNEGFAASLSGSDAVQVFEPELSDSVDVQSRVPSGPTLSRDFEPIGRQSRQLSFKTDFRGSGGTGTAPDFAKFLQASGYKASVLRQVTIGAVTGIGYQIGEQVYVGASYAAATAIGVIVAILGAGDAPIHRTTTTGHKLIVALVLGTFTASDVVVGNSSGSSNTASAAADYAGQHCFQPTSEKLVRLQTAAWSGGTIAVGNTLKIENATSGILLGAVQVQSLASQTDFQVTVLFLQNGGWHATPAQNRLRAPNGTDTTTLSTAQAATKTPSLTIRHNLDGRQRDALGARGDFTLEGEAGGPMQFAWTFTGDLVDAVDAPQIATSGLSTVRPPRLLGSPVCFGIGTELYNLPTKRISVVNGGTVSPNLDANRPGGSTGSNVTDRDMAIQVTVDAVNGGFDFEAARKNGTVVRFAALLGTVVGNICPIAAPLCQVTEVTPSDSDGIATLDVTLKPRRIRESGDDELYLAQI